jgi:hypothetical protein
MDSPAYRDALCRMKVHGNRENFLFELMQATGLLRCLTVLTPVPATIEEMKVYHDEDYLNTLFETRWVYSMLLPFILVPDHLGGES